VVSFSASPICFVVLLETYFFECFDWLCPGLADSFFGSGAAGCSPEWFKADSASAKSSWVSSEVFAADDFLEVTWASPATAAVLFGDGGETGCLSFVSSTD